MTALDLNGKRQLVDRLVAVSGNNKHLPFAEKDRLSVFVSKKPENDTDAYKMVMGFAAAAGINGIAMSSRRAMASELNKAYE